MESDHLEEAENTLRELLHQDAELGRVSRGDLEAAFYHVQKARERARNEQERGGCGK